MKSFFPSLVSASHLSRLLLFIYFAEAFGARRFVKAPRQLERSVYRGRFPGGLGREGHIEMYFAQTGKPRVPCVN